MIVGLKKLNVMPSSLTKIYFVRIKEESGGEGITEGLPFKYRPRRLQHFKHIQA